MSVVEGGEKHLSVVTFSPAWMASSVTALALGSAGLVSVLRSLGMLMGSYPYPRSLILRPARAKLFG